MDFYQKVDTMSGSGKAVIHLVNKFQVNTENHAFNCIMIYQDLDTGFCFVKPLLLKEDLEITMELFKIFTTYGPPTEVHLNSCKQDMVDNITAHMKALCPKFNINFIMNNADNNTYDIALKVVTKLHKWMEETKKDEWQIGCCVVQREINTEVSPESLISPHDRLFKQFGILKASSYVTENRNRTTDVTQEQNMSNVTRKQNIANSTSGQSSVGLLNNVSESVTIKQEIVDVGGMSSRDRILSDCELMIHPWVKEESTNVEIKIERFEH